MLYNKEKLLLSTLLVSVATVALMLLADNKVIFSFVRPRKDTRG